MCLYTEIEGLVQSGKISWERSLQEIRRVKRDRLCSMEDQELEDLINKQELSWKKLLITIREADDKNPFLKMKTALCDPIISCKTLIDENEENIDILPCNKLNQHQLLIKKELWNNLSDNAKKLIMIILESTPHDWRQGKHGKILYSRIGKTKHRITKKNIKKLVVDVLKVKPGKIDKLFNEIKSFCYEIDM